MYGSGHSSHVGYGEVACNDVQNCTGLRLWSSPLLHDASTKYYKYCILPSKRPPPFFGDPMVRVYMRYTCKCLICVNAHPRFFCPGISSTHVRLIGRLW